MAVKIRRSLSYLLVAVIFVINFPHVVGTAAEMLPVTLKAGSQYQFTFDCQSTGKYYIYSEYKAMEGYGEDINASIYLDNIKLDTVYTFDRIYCNDLAENQTFDIDYKGNQLSPQQKQLFEKTTVSFDNTGELLSLNQGVYHITLELLEEGIELYDFKVLPYRSPLTYDEYINQYSHEKNGEKILIEGEAATLKSDSSLFPINDKSSAETSPSSASCLLLNTIGGAAWKKNGQWISWDFSVPKDGLYELSFRFRQNVNMGMNSYRRIYIDGETPYQELLNVCFTSSNSWQEKTIGNEKENYYIYLKSGTHTIRLEAVSGKYTSLIHEAKQILSDLNTIYRSIIAITGVDPDIYRDYSIKETAPEILTNLSEYAVKLKKLEQDLVDITAGNNEGSGILKQLYQRMENMSTNHRQIAKNISEFKSGISSMGTWINNMDNNPLEIDYIVFGSDNGERFYHRNILERMKYSLSRFIFSFISDYDTIDTNFEDNITVWIGTGNIAGIDQMTILQSIISNQFQNQFHIGVNLKLTASSALLPATLSGIGPDVALQIAGSTPVDYGLRNAVVNLYEFHDVQEVLNRFDKSAYEPFCFNGGLYALPETQSYSMLFYRKDILQSLSIDVSSLKSWKDIWQVVLPELQRQYMDFGFFPTLENYLTLLYQKDGNLYLNNGKKSGLTTEMAMEAFDEFTMLYDSYNIPVTYDFLNRFRSGEMPLAVADFTVYNQLSVFAPEIKDLWAMTVLPGTYDEDGVLNTTGIATSMGCVMMADSENKQAAWTFMKWWTDEEAQYEFGRRLEDTLGDAARYPTANLAAFSKIKWGTENRIVLTQQRKNITGIDQVAGGYITSRYFDFSFRDVVYSGRDVRETLTNAARKIDHEIALKRQEFKID